MDAQGFRLRLDVRGSLRGLAVYRCYKRGYQDLVRAVCTSTRYEGVQGFLKFICGEEHKISDPYKKDPSIWNSILKVSSNLEKRPSRVPRSHSRIHPQPDSYFQKPQL